MGAAHALDVPLLLLLGWCLRASTSYSPPPSPALCSLAAASSHASTPRSMSAAVASKGLTNGLIAGSLFAFCAGVYVYTMNAVGRDDLDVAVAKREAAAPALAPGAKGKA